MANFTHDWFINNIGNWKQWLAEYRDTPCHALEIGCYEGRATTWLLDNILTHPASRITCIDTFEGSEEHTEFGVGFSSVHANFLGNVKPHESRVSLKIGSSSSILRQSSDPRYSIIYVDGSHQAADVLADAILSWPLLLQGGTMILDDYQWDHYPNPTHNPRLGIDSFLAAYSGKYKMVAQEYQVAVQKL